MKFDMETVRIFDLNEAIDLQNYVKFLQNQKNAFSIIFSPNQWKPGKILKRFILTSSEMQSAERNMMSWMQNMQQKFMADKTKCENKSRVFQAHE
jgi:hypothetical protein